MDDRRKDQPRKGKRQRYLDALEAEVARLSCLIAEAEERGCKCGPAAELEGCPWCRAQLQPDPNSQPGGRGYLLLEHDHACPAFVSAGVVRVGPKLLEVDRAS